VLASLIAIDGTEIPRLASNQEAIGRLAAFLTEGSRSDQLRVRERGRGSARARWSDIVDERPPGPHILEV
jgi:hypothetical protein